MCGNVNRIFFSLYRLFDLAGAPIIVVVVLVVLLAAVAVVAVVAKLD